MSFNWKESAEGSQGMSEGHHRVKCMKAMRSNKEGREYTSQKGDAQIYSVWENAGGEECLVVFTLSDAAAGMLARALECCGADLDRMTAAGIQPSRFADEDFAQKQLVGREGWAFAEKKGKYTNLSFVYESDVPPGVMYNTAGSSGSGNQSEPDSTNEPIEEDEIPFS